MVCPVFREDGRESLTARGKLHLLSTVLSATPSENFQDLFSRCLLCGACEAVCPRDMPVRERVVEARSSFSLFYGRHGMRKTLARFLLSQPALLEILVEGGRYLRKIDALPEDSGLRLKLGVLEQQTRQSALVPASGTGAGRAGSVVYFSGCLARYLQPSIAAATDKLLAGLTGSRTQAPVEQCCCGLAAWSSGNIDAARILAQKNIEIFADSDGPILTSCASCSSMLSKYFQLFEKDSPWYDRAKAFGERVCEFSQYFLQVKGSQKMVAENKLRVLYHDPCHLRFSRQGREIPRTLLDSVENTIRVEPEDGAHCCGQGGLFHLAYEELSDQIFQKSYAAALPESPDIVVTSCSGCLMQWQTGLAARKSSVRAVHLAVFLSNCLLTGLDRE